jgi:hypothetical protein
MSTFEAPRPVSLMVKRGELPGLSGWILEAEEKDDDGNR